MCKLIFIFRIKFSPCWTMATHIFVNYTLKCNLKDKAGIHSYHTTLSLRWNCTVFAGSPTLTSYFHMGNTFSTRNSFNSNEMRPILFLKESHLQTMNIASNETTSHLS